MKTNEMLLRSIPSVELVANWWKQEQPISSVEREILIDVIRVQLDLLRAAIINGKNITDKDLQAPAILALVHKGLKDKEQTNLETIINATGVVLHTNLGRAVICDQGIKAVQEVAANYSNLEMDLTTGERGSRYSHVEEYLCQLTGAEAALVVNNNASAVLLTLAELGRGKEAIVSRGELVEIGGSFRIPDVMIQSGVKLVEVGTTNKTYQRDYEQGITDQTGLLLKVHTSNYRILGFTKETSREELMELGEKYQLPVVEDLGSGFLADLSKWGITDEPRVQDCIASGVDVVTFSGDKLLGGPQAGIIVGKKEYIQRLKKHPLTRAVRIDKFTVAALEATLREYIYKREYVAIPTLVMLTMSLDEITQRAKALVIELEEAIGSQASFKLIKGSSMVGGGALPTTDLPTMLIGVKYDNLTSQQVAERLRQGKNKVMIRIQDEQILLDLRTVFPTQEVLIVNKLTEIVTGGE